MNLEKRIKQEDCNHVVLKYDGKIPDGEGGFVELYTCKPPKGTVVNWCGGTFTQFGVDYIDRYRDFITDNERYLVRNPVIE